MRILYDALSTLADAQRGRLTPHLPIFMPPLLQRWTLLADSDRDLLPLLECLTSLCQALGAPPRPPGLLWRAQLAGPGAACVLAPGVAGLPALGPRRSHAADIEPAPVSVGLTCSCTCQLAGGVGVPLAVAAQQDPACRPDQTS